MSQKQNDSMMNPPVEELLARAESKFRLVTLGASRAREINSYFGGLGEALGSSIPPQVTSVSRKPLSIAFEEIADDKIVPIIVDEDDEGGVAVVAAADDADTTDDDAG